jgi:hypothetical protein
MRKGLVPIAIVLVGFVAFLGIKGIHFLRTVGPDVAATPTPAPPPEDPGALRPVVVPAGSRVCVDQLPLDPKAKYFNFTLLRGRIEQARLDVVDPRGDYKASAPLPNLRDPGASVVVPIAPPARGLSGAVMCLYNIGRGPLTFAGADHGGRQGAPSNTSIAKVNINTGRVRGDHPSPNQLAVTLLAHPYRTLWNQRTSLLDRIAAFQPFAPWAIGLLAVLLITAVPLAVAVAVGRAAAEDDQASPSAER